MKKTTKVFSAIMMVIMAITMTSITTFADVGSFTSAYPMCDVRPEINVGDGPIVKSTSETIDQNADALNKAFSYLGADFMKALMKYSSTGRMEIMIQERDKDHVLKADFSDYEFVPATPKMNSYAEKSYSPIELRLYPTPGYQFTTYEILSEMGQVFREATGRDANGDYEAIIPQWYWDAHTKDLDAINAYSGKYREAFAMGILNGADKPCEKGTEHYKITTDIYNAIGTYMGYNTTAAQRMAGYLGIGSSQHTASNSVESTVDVTAIQKKFNIWYTNNPVVVSTVRGSTTVSTTVKNPVFYSYNEVANKISILDIKYTAKEGKIIFTSPGGLVVISEGNLTK